MASFIVWRELHHSLCRGGRAQVSLRAQKTIHTITQTRSFAGKVLQPNDDLYTQKQKRRNGELKKRQSQA